MVGAVWLFPQNQAASSLRRQIARDHNQRRARGELPPLVLPAMPAGITHRACQWPMWDDASPPPRPALFCSAPVRSGCSYCPTHAARAFAPPEGAE